MKIKIAIGTLVLVGFAMIGYKTYTSTSTSTFTPELKQIVEYIEADPVEYLEVVPFDNLPERVLVLDPIVIVSNIRSTTKDIVPVKPKKHFKCLQWRESLVGGFVRECNWI